MLCRWNSCGELYIYYLNLDCIMNQFQNKPDLQTCIIYMYCM